MYLGPWWLGPNVVQLMLSLVPGMFNQLLMGQVEDDPDTLTFW
jgi:hypothetical protein